MSFRRLWWLDGASRSSPQPARRDLPQPAPVPARGSGRILLAAASSLARADGARLAAHALPLG